MTNQKKKKKKSLTVFWYNKKKVLTDYRLTDARNVFDN